MQDLALDEELCTEPLPKSIRTYSAHFTGAGCAECVNCDFKSVYFECACDLLHNCNEYQQSEKYN
jgi:hypothetical protein